MLSIEKGRAFGLDSFVREAGAEVVADSGELHCQMKGEKGGCSSGSPLHSSMVGDASDTPACRGRISKQT